IGKKRVKVRKDGSPCRGPGERAPDSPYLCSSMAALPDISTEIRFRTARSGGKGGQHVNKVETMVEGLFDIRASALLQEDEKALVFQRLQHRINRAGILQVRSQAGRSQAENKKRVVER